MGPDELAKVYEELAHTDSDEMDFGVTRPPEKRERGRTISADAMGELQDMVNAFIAARLAYHWDHAPEGRSGIGPSVIKAEVRITVDDVHIVPDPDQRPWYFVDGGTRYDA
jgi:hypothetical protein